MQLSPSAHTDTFCRDNLPPGEQWPELRFDLPELRYPDRLNCGEALLDATVARLGPDRPCLLTPTGTWTYGDLLRRANQAAQVFTHDFGLVPGNRVLLRGPNNPWLIAAWFGVLKAGGVAVTTMPLLRAREIAALTELTRPGLAVCDDRFADELTAAAPGLPTVFYGAGSAGGAGDDLASRCAAKSGSFQAVPTAADDVALLAPTSGTTGKPKATMHFHRDVLAIADTFSRHVLRPTPDDLFAASPPLAFTFGLGQSVIFPMRAGAAVYLLEQPSPKAVLEAVDRHGISVLATAPTAYRAMLPDLRAANIKSLRACVSAGETLPK